MSESTKVLRAARVWRMDDDEHQADAGRTLFLASDDSLDRYGTRIAQDWLDDGRIAAFDSNPVIMLMHDYGALPIGQAADRYVKQLDDGRRAMFIDVAWDMDDEEAARIAGKYARGIMRAGSVGFATHRVTPLRELEDGHPWRSERGELLQHNELREFSAVPIPGNANALVQGRFGPAEWLAAGLIESAPESVRDAVRDLLLTDAAVQAIVREAAGDLVRSTVETATKEARAASAPLSWLFRGNE